MEQEGRTAAGMADMRISRRGLINLLGAAAVAGAPLPQAFAGAAEKATATAGPVQDAAGLPWPDRGSFGGKAIVGPHQPGAAAMLSKEPIMGLGRESSFFYGALRDGDGTLYEVVRGLPERANTLSSLFVQDNAGKDTLHVVPAVMQAAAPSTGFEAAMVDGKGVWKSAAGAPGKPFEITMSADGAAVTWKEEGLLDLTGTLLGPGMQWYIADREGCELYVSQIYLMKGSYMGRPVRGIMPFDQAYLPEGQTQYSGKDPLFRPQVHHRCWYTWATVYKDGSYDAAHFVLGTDRLGFAIHTNERQQMMLETEVSGEVSIGAEGTWPAHISLQAGHTRWEYLPDPHGRMPDLLGGVIQSTTPQNEGRWRRVGDTREPEAWFAWGEVAPAGRTGYARVYRW
jgi:hypothetical protein